MIKIPGSDKKYVQPNTTNLFGNAWYVKNISFRKKGYAKLASKVVAIASEKLDPNFQLPLSFGRGSGGQFLIATIAKNYIANLSPASFLNTADAGSSVPTNDSDTTGRWFNNLWHVTTGTHLYQKASNGNWADKGLTLTSGSVHDLEVFRARGTLCISDGNVVQQVDSGYSKSNQFDLTIPADYEITFISFNSDRLGVGTKLSDAAAGQNQNAFFFVWDGKATSPNGSYDTGSDMVVAVIPYASQWIVITRTGQALKFNGSGFDDKPLFTLPFFYENILWGDSINRQALADCFTVEGDRVYINIPTSLNVFGPNGETYLENYPGGTLCYDPEVGLYNQYSPSASVTHKITVAQADVNTTTNTFENTSGTIPITGNPVKYIAATPGSEVGGLVANSVYYMIKVTDTSFRLALTRQDAIDLNAIDLTSQGISTNTFLAVDIVDYGVIYSTGRSGGICLANEHKVTYDHVIFGAELLDYASQTNYGFCCVTMPGFRNIGYMVSPRLSSSEVTDMIEKNFLKFEQLNNDDKIILKYKNKSITGIPVSTPETNGAICTWVDSKTFTVTTDLSVVKSYLDEDEDNACEVEIIAGAGAGQMSQIDSITLNGSTYTVVLEDDIEAALSGRLCDVIINNWKTIAIADVSDTLGYKDFTVDRDAKWTMFKLILDGVDITLEEQNIISKVETPAA